jgi:hypothetical protein
MTFDINITEFVSNNTPVDFNFTIGGKIVDNHKLAQSWIKMFLTELGSQLYFPATGTNFLEAMRTGVIRDAASVNLQFKLASDLVAETLNTDALTNALPDTEQLLVAELVSFEILKSESKLKLFITLTPVQGDTVSFSVPVSTKV